MPLLYLRFNCYLDEQLGIRVSSCKTSGMLSTSKNINGSTIVIEVRV